MSNLRLRLNMFGDEPLGTTDVIANIFPSDRSAPQDLRRRLRNLPIPAGDKYEQWASVELPLGRYEVQVLLPSGELITRDIEIKSDTDEPLDVALEAPSPHEWLATQHFQGNVGSRDQRRMDDKEWMVQSLERGAADAPRLVSVLTSPRQQALDLLGPSLEVAVNVRWCEDLKPPDMAETVWDILYQIIRDRPSPQEAAERFWHDLPIHEPPPVPPVFHIDGVRTYRFVLDGPLPSGATSTGGHHAWDSTPPRRRYVLVSNDEETRLVCAPVPWFDLASGQTEVAFELMSPLGSAGVTTAVRDTELGSIIGYLTSNALQHARLLVDKASDMLCLKFSNPLGAAAGAYVMLSTEHQRKDESWHHWIGNFYQKFPWIPDGAIAYANLKLNYQQTDQDVDAALEAILTAYRRGVPFYTLGMRWLLDALTAFAEDEIYAHRRDEIVHHLQRVRVIAQRTNYQQPFTSIQISHRNR